jgi:peptide/nickel transport system permease protein
MLAVLAVVFVGSRALVRFLPGNPIDTILAESGTSLSRETIERDLGLDRPFFTALASDAARMFRGDFGTSLISRRPVAPLLRERSLRTLALALLSMAIGVAFSLALGLGSFRSRAIDRVCSLHGALSASLPTAWIGPVLLFLLAVKLPLFPVGGSVLLPALTLGLAYSGLWSRLVRERVGATLNAGPATAARARGLGELPVIFKYGLAPSAGALVAYLGTQLGALMGGAFVTETIFDWAGLGTLLVESVLKRDYTSVEAAVFVAATASLVGTWLGDFAQQAVDPRQRSAGRA